MHPSVIATWSDEELILAVKARDERAFGALYDRYSPLAYGACLRILRHPMDAQPVLSEVFWEVWNSPERYNPARGTFRTYLMILVRSRAIDQLRKQSRPRAGQGTQVASDEDQLNDPKDSFNPIQIAIHNETTSAVAKAITTLSEVQQEALQLAFFCGLTHMEIAEQLNLPLGTVKTRIRQGLINLRTELRIVNLDWNHQ